MLGFDLGDGGPPAWLPPTPETTATALRIVADAGGDPASVLLPPRRGAMGADALAAAPTKAPSVMLDIGPQPPAVKVGIGAPLELTPMAPPQGGAGLPDLAPSQIAKGFSGRADAGPTPGVPQSGGEDLRKIAAQVQAANQPAGPAGPPQLVPTPQQAAGQGTAASPPAGQSAQEYANWLSGEIMREASKRPSAGVLVKGGKTPTGEQTQALLGPNADTLAALQANADARQRVAAPIAEADAKAAQAQADAASQQAGAEQRAADARAEMEQRRAAALGQITTQSRELQQKLATAEIDPNRLWKSSAPADKIGLLAALIGGGVGQVLMKQNGVNPVMQGLQTSIDRDVDAQVRNIDKQRGDLTELQRVYQQTKSTFDDEGVAIDAAKLAAIQGAKAQLAQELARAQAVQGTERAHDPRAVQEAAALEQAWREAMGADTPMAQAAAEARYARLLGETRSFPARARAAQLEMERLELEKRADLETKINGSIARTYGFTKDQVVGGSAGSDRKRIQSLYKERADIEGDQRKLAVSERGAEKDQKALFVDGAPLPVGAGASQGSVDKAQDLITFADQGLDMVASAAARAQQGGGMVPGDPRIKIASAGIASVLSNAQGGGAPNDAVMKTIESALTVGPRQQAAIDELKGEFTSAKRRALQRVGAAKLWPARSRCIARTRARLYRSTRARPARFFAQGGPPSRPIKTCPWWARTAAFRCSKAPMRGLTSPARQASLAGHPRAKRCVSSGFRTSTGASPGSSGRSAWARSTWAPPTSAPPP